MADAGTMRIWGVICTIAGLAAALIALILMPSTISTEEMTTLPYTGSVIGSGVFTETYNLPRAQVRELVFHGGCVLFLAGVILIAVGRVGEMLGGGFYRQVQDPLSEPSVEPVASPILTAMPSPEFLARDPEDEARDARMNKILVGLVMLPVVLIAGIWLFATVSNATRGQSAGSTIAAAKADNASVEADEALNAAQGAADNAAKILEAR